MFVTFPPSKENKSMRAAWRFRLEQIRKRHQLQLEKHKEAVRRLQEEIADIQFVKKAKKGDYDSYSNFLEHDRTLDKYRLQFMSALLLTCVLLPKEWVPAALLILKDCQFERFQYHTFEVDHIRTRLFYFRSLNFEGENSFQL